MKKLTTLEFLARARDVHGDTYDYEHTVFMGTKKNVTIICRIHGEFSQLCANHLKGLGCYHCGIAGNRLSHDDFITRAIAMHDHKYDYSKVIVDGANNKVIIICPVHGDFQQRAAGHLSGLGCSLCNERQGLTQEDFVSRSVEIHKGKYTYDHVHYVNINTKVTIICSAHGLFNQTPKEHLRGSGCAICGGKSPVLVDDFIVRANKTHNDKYDYAKLVFDGMNSKGIITCSVHGDFAQRLADHVDGAGCPTCSLYTRGRYSSTYFDSYPDERDVVAILYLVIVDEQFCKVGITKHSVAQRFGNSQVKTVLKIDTTLGEAYIAEQRVLDKFKNSRYRANGLKSRTFAGWTECFPLAILPMLEAEFKVIKG